MENLVVKIAEQVPNLGILGLIVYFFLSHLARRDEVLRDLHKEHIDERQKTRDVVKENTDSNKELIRVINKIKGS
jgi:hypothetical protein